MGAEVDWYDNRNAVYPRKLDPLIARNPLTSPRCNVPAPVTRNIHRMTHTDKETFLYMAHWRPCCSFFGLGSARANTATHAIYSDTWDVGFQSTGNINLFEGSGRFVYSAPPVLDPGKTSVCAGSHTHMRRLAADAPAPAGGAPVRVLAVGRRPRQTCPGPAAACPRLCAARSCLPVPPWLQSPHRGRIRGWGQRQPRRITLTSASRARAGPRMPAQSSPRRLG